MIDLRCSATEPGPRKSRHLGRCQLLAGHEGPHAVMFVRAGRRAIRTWRDGDAHTVKDHPMSEPNLPWGPGMPQPVRDAARGLTA